MKIAVVVPTIREEQMKVFTKEWESLFAKHNAELFTVWDGDNPRVTWRENTYGLEDVMGNNWELIFNKSDVVRNLGFITALQKYNPDIYITLDDDTLPLGDTIQAHLDTLERSFPANWMSTATRYVRGVPYEIRNEMPCMVSHGVWAGVKDWDAPTQLVQGNLPVEFYKGHIPKGVFFPLCGMNVAFKKEVLPYFYFAPMGYKVNLDRFGDIWLGINLKKVCDSKDWAIATGYAIVKHERASNVFTNLVKEARGIGLNENYWLGREDDPYFAIYNVSREKWEKYVTNLQSKLNG